MTAGLDSHDAMSRGLRGTMAADAPTLADLAEAQAANHESSIGQV